MRTSERRLASPQQRSRQKRFPRFAISLSKLWTARGVDRAVRRRVSTARALVRKKVVGRRAPALDGIRGIAILAVVLFHCSLRLDGRWRMAGSWGWMGVDLFFVLSGFFITGI